MDVGFVSLGVAEDLLNRVKSATEQILAKLFDTSTSEKGIEVDTLNSMAVRKVAVVTCAVTVTRRSRLSRSRRSVFQAWHSDIDVTHTLSSLYTYYLRLTHRQILFESSPIGHASNCNAGQPILGTILLPGTLRTCMVFNSTGVY